MHNYTFRGKGVTDGKWYVGCFLKDSKRSYIVPDESVVFDIFEKGCSDLVTVDPVTISPSIEMKTFNRKDETERKDIFVNDIVRFTFSFGGHEDYLIVHENELPTFEAISLDNLMFNGYDYYRYNGTGESYDVFLDMIRDPYNDFESLTIIGNIFDNHELIQKALDENYMRMRKRRI